jgi:hypothetical protein
MPATLSAAAPGCGQQASWRCERCLHPPCHAQTLSLLLCSAVPLLRQLNGLSTRAFTCACLPRPSRPRELPVVEGQPLVGLELKRLGLKATW